MYLYLEDTICAPATSVGGAVAMIRVSGANALSIVDKLVVFRNGTACASKGYSLKFGTIAGLDDVVVAIFRNPNSYTGEDSAEISCHASSFIVSSILNRLLQAGCRIAEAGEFTRRAFINGKMDLAQAEAVADLISSSSSAQHRIAYNQVRGGYSAQLACVRSQLLELASLLELELDFSEEELEFADRGKLVLLLDSAIDKCSSLADSYRLGNAIRNGVPVAIIGSPNSGKSTLLNALLEDDRAIVSSIAGTTRDTIEETCTIGGVLFRFIDTAGIRESSDVVESLGIERSFAKASSAEIVIGMVDINSNVEAEIATLRAMDISGKLLIVINKIDESCGDACMDGVDDCVNEGVDVGDGVRHCEGVYDRGNLHFVPIAKNYDCGNTPRPPLSLCSEHLQNTISFTKFVNPVRTKLSLRRSLLQSNENNLYISAKTGQGLNELRTKLVSLVGTVSEDAILVTNARHAAALKSAAHSLIAVRKGLGIPIPTDLLAEDLREAIRVLGTITGEITTDEVLGNIFKNFCIGK